LTAYTTQLSSPLDSKSIDTQYLPPVEFYSLPRVGGYFSEIQAMLMDSQIQANLGLRKRTALSFPRQITGDENACALIRDVVSKITFQHDLEGMLGCLEYGYMPNEIIWELRDGVWWIRSIEQRDPSKFRVHKEHGWQMLIDGQWQEIPPRKFIMTTHQAGYENPYGTSCLLSSYPAWKAKLAVSAYMVKLAKKYAVPSVIALTDAASEAELNRISDTLSQLESSSGVALAGVSNVIQLTADGQAEALRTVIEFYNLEIAKAVTGQSLAMEQGDTGSYAQARVHEGSLAKLAAQDVTAVAHKLNRTLIPWILELNGIRGTASLSISTATPPSLEDFVKAIEAGVPVSRQGFYQATGLPQPKDDQDTLAPRPVQKQPVNLADRDDYLLIRT